MQKTAMKKVLEIDEKRFNTLWNCFNFGLSHDLREAQGWLTKCVSSDKQNLDAEISLAGVKALQGEASDFDSFLKTEIRHNRYFRSYQWVLTLGERPKILFNTWHLFDVVLSMVDQNRPFYEFGVWRGHSFRYFLNTLEKGYGFDTFEGLPESTGMSRTKELTLPRGMSQILKEENL